MESTLDEQREKAMHCTRCALAETRTRVVYGEGSAHAKMMLIGEGPGADEDKTGRPFVGRAGQLLTKMLAAIDIQREDVFIANIVKCRPPGNRDPQPDEVSACLPWLKEQIRLIKPKIILLLGRVAANTLLQKSETMSAYRQSIHRYENVPVYVTYHPSALLRNTQWKRPAWEDLKRIREHYNSL